MWKKAVEILEEIDQVVEKWLSKEKELEKALEKQKYPRVLSLIKDVEILSQKLSHLERKRGEIFQKLFQRDISLSLFVELLPEENARIIWEGKARELREKVSLLRRLHEKNFLLLEVHFSLAEKLSRWIQRLQEAGYSPEGEKVYSPTSYMEIRG